MIASALRTLGSKSTFVRFCAAGAIGFVVDAGLVQALVSLFEAPPVPTRFVSFTLAATVTWQINRRLTFVGAHLGSAPRQWFRYLSVNAVGAGVNLALYTLLVINSSFLARYPFAAVLAASAAALIINFTASKRYVFVPSVPLGAEQRRRRRIVFCAIAIFAAVLAIQGMRTKNWTPVSDENDYLAYAYGMLHHGVYGLSFGEGRPAPSFFREPGLPLLVAAVMAVDPTLRGVSPACWLGKPPACDTRPYRSLQWLNVLLVALTALAAGRTAFLLSGNWIVGLVGAGAIALNIQVQAIRYSIMSDYLAMLLAALIAWLAVVALRSQSRHAAAGCGLALAALVLTKAVFLYFLVFAIVAVVGFAVFRSLRPVWIAASVFIVAASAPVLGWMAYHKASGGSFAIVDSMRSAIALSGRERFNDMTAPEWATSFLWWTRAVGDNIARRHLPADLHRRIDDGNKDSLFQSGEARFYSLRDARMKQPGIGIKVADTAVMRDMAGRILDRPFKHLAVSLPLAYRGIWIDEFAVLSVPSLFVVLIMALRRRQWTTLAVFSPGLYSLMIYPLASVNLPRYQMTAVPLLALVLALAVGLYLDRRKARRQIAN